MFLAVWLRKLATIAVILGFLELILPEGELHRFARVTLGLLVVLALLQPLAALFREPYLILAPAVHTPGRMDGANEAAARIAAAGLKELQGAKEDACAREIRDLCRSAGIRPSAVEVAIGGDGQLRVKIRLSDPDEVPRVQAMVAGHLTLPPAMVEVIADE